MNIWYDSLTRPPLTPPAWIFPPVWSTLYVMIAVGIVLWARSPDKFLPRQTWLVIVLHLVANFSWSPIFFGMQSPAIALGDILLVWVTLLVLLVRFFRESRWSYYLWFPYFLWVSFATYLNAGFWWLNR